ncbi:hypothetical protein IM538_22115 [Cytobacillus suaedae]|nr:hypothetical protein IM538_22115 [Cytobacillus suaedae]
MKSKVEKFNSSSTTRKIAKMKDYLAQINHEIQSPSLKKRIIHIENLLNTFRDIVEPEETRYRESVNKRRVLVSYERERTSYNPSTDGRVPRANYSGQGDMGFRNK